MIQRCTEIIARCFGKNLHTSGHTRVHKLRSNIKVNKLLCLITMWVHAKWKPQINPFWPNVNNIVTAFPWTNTDIWSTKFVSSFCGLFQSYAASWHCILYQHIHECSVCLLLSSGSHNLNCFWNERHLYITAHQCYQHSFMYRHTFAFSHNKMEI
jgi:hypothetical protein